MKVLGGMALNNQVTYVSEKYSVTAKLKNGKIKLSYNKKEFGKITSKLIKVPFLRGPVRLLKIFLSNTTTPILLILLLLLNGILSLIFNKLNIFFPLSNFINLGDLILGAIMVMFIKIFVGKYHGAEHKVLNAWVNNYDLTLDNVAKASRVSKRCGTNLAVFVIILFIPLSLILPIFLSAFISFSIGYELFKNKKGAYRKISNIFFKIGGILQYYLFTSEPSKKELILALEAFKKLQELEEY